MKAISLILNYLQLLVLILLFSFCINTNTETSFSPDFETSDLDSNSYKMQISNDTSLIINNVKIIIKVPQSDEIKGSFLLLPGWNLSSEDWCQKTSICDSILKKSYYVVLAEMGKSNYHSQIFEETKNELKNTPNLFALTDSIIPYLQNLGILIEKQNNFIVGLSTGGRGVVRVCQHLPNLFNAAAALSGDFDQSLMPNDKVHRSFYGEFSKFSDRWKTFDNPVFEISKMNTPIYIGHGKNDKITPHNQSFMFYDSLKKHKPELKTELIIKDAAHDYSYWASEVENILNFFKKFETKKTNNN